MTWCKLQIHAVGGPSDLIWVYTQVIEQEGLHTGTVKILNSHGTATYLRFIKSTSFYFCTYSPLFIGYFQERLLLKWTDICQNILHFKSYHQQKFTNCLGFWQISKRKLLSLTSAYSFIKKNLYVALDLEFFLRLNGNFCYLRKASFRYGFSIAINAFFETVGNLESWKIEKNVKQK